MWFTGMGMGTSVRVWPSMTFLGIYFWLHRNNLDAEARKSHLSHSSPDDLSCKRDLRKGFNDYL